MANAIDRSSLFGNDRIGHLRGGDTIAVGPGIAKDYLRDICRNSLAGHSRHDDEWPQGFAYRYGTGRPLHCASDDLRRIIPQAIIVGLDECQSGGQGVAEQNILELRAAVIHNRDRVGNDRAGTLRDDAGELDAGRDAEEQHGGRAVGLSVTGSYSVKTDMSKVALKGVPPGPPMKLNLVVSFEQIGMAIESLKGKAFGQSLISE